MSSPRLSCSRVLLVLPVVLFLALLAWGLRSGSKPELNVQQTYEYLRTCRQTGAYAGMRPYIEPAARDGMIDLLVAVDELMLAHSSTIAAMKQACPDIDAEPYERVFAGTVQDSLGLFSRDVDLVSIREQGDFAIVTIQVAKKTPLQRLTFGRNQGVWQYMPGPEDPEAVKQVRQRTRSLRQIEMALTTTRMTPPQIYRECQIRLSSKADRSHNPG